jgi:hypothetical protein
MKMKKEIIAPCVVVYKDVFSPENIIDLIEEESEESWPYLVWEYSGTDNGTISSYRTSMQMEMSPVMTDNVDKDNRAYRVSTLWMNIFSQVDNCVHDYRENYDLHLSSDEGYRILKYSGGAEYRPHVDYGHNNSRQLSLVGWLNDDYDGGELDFTYLGVKVKPEAGGLIMFPSSYPYKHAALPVGDNSFDIKYSFVTWFN